MDWRDEGMLISVRPHGETSAIIEAFTPGRGRHAGVVRGGVSRRIAPMLQPGALVDLSWRARLEDHIGAFTVEPLRSRAAILSDRAALAALNSLCALLRFGLPEREPHPRLYGVTQVLAEALAAGPGWTAAYLRWELLLLEELGYALDLSRCAVTGQAGDLAFVSPRSGRAVSRAGAGDWADRLLPLPPVLLGQEPGADPLAGDVAAALRLTGHFLDRMAGDLGDRPLPEARRRLVDLLARAG
ncbi:DNA repair protein RecO [Frigidibacter oleivorans]|uniref:DNA repair protein RecO n=1 Tax=Frigidibacter oleivorans TaxID=2487129 RepID=UPI000F8D20A6|nr:DNA repair protein RecO [Frigidibacter oleivorans]